MSWGDVIAAVGGAAGGVQKARQFYMNQDRERQVAELRQMLALVAEGGRNARAEGANTARQQIADANRGAATDKANADRELKGQQVANDLEKFWASDSRTRDLAGQRDDTTRRGQDFTEGRFWGGTLPLGYQRDATTQRGQDMSATTARRGQDMTASTAARGQDVTARGQDLTATSGGANRRARRAIDILRMQQKDDSSLLADPNNATDWAAKYDKLYNDPGAAADAAIDAAAPADTAPAPAPPPAAPVGAPMPVAPRGSSRTAPGGAAPDARTALAAQMTSLVQQITAAPAGPKREALKTQLQQLRQQAETLRSSTAQD